MLLNHPLFALNDIHTFLQGADSLSREVVNRAIGWAEGRGWVDLPDGGGGIGDVEQTHIVVVTTVEEWHRLREQVVVGEDQFHGRFLGSGCSRPAPNLTSCCRRAYHLAEVASLIAMQVYGGVISCADFAVDGLIPAETRLLKVCIINTINDIHTLGRIVWPGIVGLLGIG